MDAYRTPEGTATARLVEKKSEFISHVSFADSEETALAFLNAIRAEHRTASHNVYAYILREGNRERYSDDGEPAKTSGLPTLEAIRHAGLTDCIVVTTRYFGGTLLGTGGLVRAYTEAAKLALETVRQVSMRVCVRGTLRIDYARYEQAAKLLAEAGARLDEPTFTDLVELSFLLPDGAQDALVVQLQELCRGQACVTLSKPCHAPY